MNQNPEEYEDPKHPIDLQIDAFSSIRAEFIRHQQLNRIMNRPDDGMDKGVLCQLLAPKIQINPKQILKILNKSIHSDKVSWNDFQQILDKETELRDQILNFVMFDLNSTRFKHSKDIDLKPNNRESERIFYIEQMQEMFIDNKLYYLVVFDDSTVSVLDPQKFSIVTEFSMKYIFKYKEFIENTVEKKKKFFETQNRYNSLKPLQNTTLSSFTSRQPSLHKVIADSQELMNNTQSTAFNPQQQHLAHNKKNIHYTLEIPQKLQNSKQQSIFQSNKSPPLLSSSQKYSFQKNHNNDQNSQKQPAFKYNQDQISKYLKSGKAVDLKTLQNNSNHYQYNNNKKQQNNQNNNQKGQKYQQYLQQQQIFFGNNNNNKTKKLQQNQSQKSWQQQQQFQNQHGEIEMDLFFPVRGERYIQLIQQASKMLRIHLKEVNEEINQKNKSLKISFLFNAIPEKPKRYDLRERLRLAMHIVRFWQKLKIRSETTRILKIKNMKISRVLPQDYIEYIKENKLLMRLIFNKFKDLNIQDSQQFSYAIIQLLKDKQIHIINPQNVRNLNYNYDDNLTRNKLQRTAMQEIANLPEIYKQQKTQQKLQEKLNEENIFKKKPLTFKERLGRAKSVDVRQLQDYQTIIENKQKDLFNDYKKRAEKILKQVQDDSLRIDINPRTLKHRRGSKAKIYLPQTNPEEEFQNNPKQQQQEKKRAISQNNNNNQRQDKLARQDEIKTNKKLHIFSIDYNQHHNLIALGLVNNQLAIYQAYFHKNQLKISQIKTLMFQTIVCNLAFHQNQINKSWNIICLFKNKKLKIFQYEYLQKSQEVNIDIDTPIYRFNFDFETDLMKYHPNFGAIVTGYTGDMALFADKTTHISHKNQVYNLFHKQKILHDKSKKPLSLTHSAYSDNLEKIVLGTLCGKIVFFDTISKTILAQCQAASTIIIGIHILEEQNLAIIVSQDKFITIWDLIQHKKLQQIKSFSDKNSVFQVNITKTYFCPLMQNLFVCANQIKSYKSFTDEELETKRRKLQVQYFWRNTNRQKQKINQDFNQNNLFQSSQSKLNKNKNKYENYPDPNQQKHIEKVETYNTQRPKHYTKQYQQLKSSLESQRNKQQFKQIEILNVQTSNQQTIVLYDNLKELKLFDFQKLKLKYSFVLDTIETIVAMDIKDQFLAYTTEKGDIFIINMYTSEILHEISHYDSCPQRIEHIKILPQKGEFFLAGASLEGRVIFFRKKGKHITINTGSKQITSVCLLHDYFITANEEQISTFSQPQYTRGKVIKIPQINYHNLQPKQPQQQNSNSNKNIATPTERLGGNYDIIYMKELSQKQNRVICMTKNGDIHEIDIMEGCSYSFLNNIGQNARFTLNQNETVMAVINQDLDLVFYQRDGFPNHPDNILQQKYEKQQQLLNEQSPHSPMKSAKKKLEHVTNIVKLMKSPNKNQKKSKLFPNLDFSKLSQHQQQQQQQNQPSTPIKTFWKQKENSSEFPLSVFKDLETKEYNQFDYQHLYITYTPDYNKLIVFLNRQMALIVDTNNYSHTHLIYKENQLKNDNNDDNDYININNQFDPDINLLEQSQMTYLPPNNNHTINIQDDSLDNIQNIQYTQQSNQFSLNLPTHRTLTQNSYQQNQQQNQQFLNTQQNTLNSIQPSTQCDESSFILVENNLKNKLNDIYSSSQQQQQ